MNGIFRLSLKMLVVILCSIAVGYLLLVIAFCIPQNRLFKGLADSVPVLERDNPEELVFGYPGSRLDIFSDGAILNAVLHSNGESPFRRAIACYQYVYNDMSRAEAFITYFEPREPDASITYIRYWHGILTVLKPLFLFFNYSDIRLLNHLGQMLIVFFAVYAFARRGLKRYLPALIISYFFLMPFTLPMSIQYSSVFYIGMGSLAVLVFFYDRLKNRDGILMLFLLTGILTSYMDLLTYPTFTLGFPLVGLLIIKGTSEDVPPLKLLADIVKVCITWGLGYAGMWAGKILISVPFYGMSAFSDALENAGKRSVSGAAAEGISYMDAMTANFFMYKNNIFKLVLILYTIVLVVYIIYTHYRKKNRLPVGLCGLYLLVCAIPFVWFFVTTEHAQVHAFMTYKNLTVTVFSYCTMLVSLTGYTAGRDNKEGRSE